MGAIDTSYTFTATDVITSTKMNNILDQSTITETAIIGSTLAVSVGKLSVAAGGITSNELAVGAVTTTALTDLNVTTGKIADLGVTTGKINDLSVTFLKLATDAVATVAEAKAQTASKLVTADNVKQSPPSAKAYGSFTAATSTRTLSGAYNIASATRIDLDETAIAFTSPMASAGYTVLCQTTNSGSTGTATILLSENPTVYNKTTTGFKIVHSNESTSRAVDFVVFGTLA